MSWFSRKVRAAATAHSGTLKKELLYSRSTRACLWCPWPSWAHVRCCKQTSSASREGQRSSCWLARLSQPISFAIRIETSSVPKSSFRSICRKNFHVQHVVALLWQMMQFYSFVKIFCNLYLSLFSCTFALTDPSSSWYGSSESCRLRVMPLLVMPSLASCCVADEWRECVYNTGCNEQVEKLRNHGRKELIKPWTCTGVFWSFCVNLRPRWLCLGVSWPPSCWNFGYITATGLCQSECAATRIASVTMAVVNAATWRLEQRHLSQ